VGFVVDKGALGQGFSKYFAFRCKFSFHQMLHTHQLSGAGIIGQLVADVPSGVSLPQEIKKKITVAGIIQVTAAQFQTLVTS
jgi:hypothetical protein